MLSGDIGRPCEDGSGGQALSNALFLLDGKGMTEVLQKAAHSPVSDDLLRIVSTSILIYDSAITLLGEPSAKGVEMPAPAHVACMRNILTSLGIGKEDDGNTFPA